MPKVLDIYRNSLEVELNEKSELHIEEHTVKYMTHKHSKSNFSHIIRFIKNKAQCCSDIQISTKKCM